MNVELLRRSARAAAVALGVAILTGMSVAPPLAGAQEPAPTPKPAATKPAEKPAAAAKPAAFDPTLPTPPEVTGGVFQNSLANADILPSGRCFGGRSHGEAVDEGFKVTVGGRCVESAETAELALPARGVSIGDGDLAMDVKAVAGAQRAQVTVYLRNQPGKLAGVTVNLASGEAKVFTLIDGNMNVVASRTDIGGLATPTDWNRLGLRVRGGELWLLLNDDPILYAADVLTDVGGAGVRLLREGNPDDEDETAVVFRDLTLSTVAGGGDGRAPAYNQP
ncbi:MAG: hypothetical protein IT306_08100 [Chloroflexi bacterium]|nr:hypothetical protein [Chloroflexota bacterium]